MTCRTGKPGQDWQDRTARTGQPGRDCLKRTAMKGQPERYCRNRTGLTRQECQDKIVRTAETGQYSEEKAYLRLKVFFILRANFLKFYFFISSPKQLFKIFFLEASSILDKPPQRLLLKDIHRSR
jgi:hypothetical protein